MRIPLRTIATLCIALTIGVVVGWTVHALITLRVTEDLSYSLRDTTTSYTYIKPLLACNISAVEDSDEYIELKATLITAIQEAENRGDIENAAVYYRDLDSGLWTGVNIDDTYTPASLLKVPVLLAYLKQAEQDRSLLTTSIVVRRDPLNGQEQYIPPAETVEVGKSYTIEDLLKLMVIHSDNRALAVLTSQLDVSIRNEILEDLDIPAISDNYTISARFYSRLFRILYNGTYLSHDDSELALSWLAQSAFDDGLRAGTPETLSIAHKFGEAPVTLADGENGHELHDCGIVYDEHPYLLCVMTRGRYTDRLGSVIVEIAELTSEKHASQ